LKIKNQYDKDIHLKIVHKYDKDHLYSPKSVKNKNKKIKQNIQNIKNFEKQNYINLIEENNIT
jgi:hypothetical protein